jgi:sulfoxide reductase catalytic subunit YedY
MNIKILKPWEFPLLQATPESTFMNRRALLKALGFGVAAMTVGCETQGPKAVKSIIGGLDEEMDYKPTTELNTAYSPGRAITNRKKATTFNNFYEFSPNKDDVYQKVGKFTISPWTVEVGGLVNNPVTLDMDDIRKKFPVEERLYRFRCVETWAMTVPWQGFSFSHLLKMVDPKPEATHVSFLTFMRPEQAPMQKQKNLPWPYEEGLTIEEAMNELTFMATGMYGTPLEKQNGAPLRLVVPWKYGFKSTKSIVKISFTNYRPGTFWNTLVPKEYGFEANVDPAVPHPRWSQATERLIDTGDRVDTMIYNGYGKEVAHLYAKTP